MRSFKEPQNPQSHRVVVVFVDVFLMCFRNKPFGMPEMLTFFIIVIIRFKVAFLAQGCVEEFDEFQGHRGKY